MHNLPVRLLVVLSFGIYSFTINNVVLNTRIPGYLLSSNKGKFSGTFGAMVHNDVVDNMAAQSILFMH